MGDIEHSDQTNLDTTIEHMPPALEQIERTIQANYDQLEMCIERARAIVPVSDVKQLLELLPPGSIESQRFLLGELIKLDMAAASESRIPTDQTTPGDTSPRLLEFYLPACSNWLTPEDLPLDLVLEEMRLRRASGDVMNLTEYRQRFPQWADALADMNRQSQGDAQAGVSPRSLKPGLPELVAGQTIDDFQIIRCLGRGGFAQVYLAYQPSMQRHVALKVTQFSSQEPQTLSQLDHPNIVRVYDQRTLPSLEIHLLYMQAILGGTLASVVKATRTKQLAELNGSDVLAAVDASLIEAQQQPPERGADPLRSMNWAATTAWIGAKLAEGLQAAHDRGILHLDVKPANVLLAPTGSPKLVDFNVSDRGLSSLREKRVGGTLPYMSPEHLSAASESPELSRVDQRSDSFSLAVTLWELWQGERPWPMASVPDTWSNAIQDQLSARQLDFTCRRVDTSAEGIWLERVLRSTMDPDPNVRPQSCQELATRLVLTHHPELVSRFTPSNDSLAGHLLRMPVLLATSLVSFLSNGPMGAINFFYNREVIVRQFKELLPQFRDISIVLNSIAFPVAGALLILFCWLVQRSLKRAHAGAIATESEIDFVWRFGHRAAVISGVLWLAFGLIFPVVLQRYEPDLKLNDFVHFFISLSICGGIALIYPFFGISLLSIYIYYPQLISRTMSDPNFAERSEWLRRRAELYLVLAASVPLLAIGLLIVMKSNAPQMLQVSLVGIALVSLFVSFKAYQLLLKMLSQYEGLFAGSK